MNQLKIQQAGGYPLDTDTLNFVQDAYTELNSLGGLAGNLIILQGCEVTGSIVANGFVYINGEVLSFKGATLGTNVIVSQVATPRVFEDGLSKDVYLERFATFGSGGTSFPWADFKRVMSNKEIQRRMLPPGTNPQLYSGAINVIPTGWQLCDGTNGTPDLRGRFIVGFNPNDTDYNAIGKAAGLKEVELTGAQNGEHNHVGSTDTDGAHSHTAPADGGSTNSGGSSFRREGGNTGVLTTNTGGTHSHGFTTDSDGLGEPHENRPPYYTLAYIIYTG